MSDVQRVGGAPTSAGVWESLEQRFGPSDEDRPAWLGARQGGLTATEVRDLWLLAPGRRALAMAELVEKKLGRKADSFSGNKYTAWGKDREPIIAELVRERYGIAPESRLVHAAANPRHLASPDGIGVGFDGALMLAEIKTSGHDIAPRTSKFTDSGYLAQMVWQMYVVGAEKCLFAYEVRLGSGTDDDPFHPGVTGFHWFDRLDYLGLLDELLAIADEFLALLDAAADEPFVEPDIDEHLDTLAVNVLRGRELEAEAKGLKEPAWKELQAALDERGVPFQQESVLARITYTPAEVTSTVELDEEAAIAADPALHQSMLDAAAAAAEWMAKHEAAIAAWDAHAAQFSRPGPDVEGRSRLTVSAVRAQKGSRA